MKRLFDFTVAGTVLFILAVPLLLVALAVRLSSQGPALYWSDRVGRSNRLFRMPKFRSMYVNTPSLPTHLLKNPTQHITPIGSFLRKSSIDELPQLWSILKGDMSFVGPRPALFNQNDLITLRNKRGVSALRPGLTGWAQIKGRDELTTAQKAELDTEYLKKHSFFFDLMIIGVTIFKVIRRDEVSH